jgi:hypothetical protein
MPLDRRAQPGRGRADLQEQERERRANDMRGVRANPSVRSILDSFPGAEIVAVRLPRADDADDAGG